MPWSIVLWVVAFVIQAALLGANMWGLVVLSDLEVSERAQRERQAQRRPGPPRQRGERRGPLSLSLSPPALTSSLYFSLQRPT